MGNLRTKFEDLIESLLRDAAPLIALRRIGVIERPFGTIRPVGLSARFAASPFGVVRVIGLAPLLCLFVGCITIPDEIIDPEQSGSIEKDADGSPKATARGPLRNERPQIMRIPKDHADRMDLFAAGDTEFAGIYEAFELKAVLHNDFVTKSLLKRQSQFYQWEDSKIGTERDRLQQERSNETLVFISFSAQSRHDDNMHKPQSIWRLYLDAQGKRYEGTVKRDRRPFSELLALYPFHTRWNTAYMVRFPVSIAAIESGPIKVTVTGPLGTRVLEFPELRPETLAQLEL